MANDFNAQTTIDRRFMATIAKYLEEQGADIRSLSDLTRVALESFASLLIEKLGAKEITSSEEATNILGKLTYGQALYQSKRFGANFAANILNRTEEITRSRGRQPEWTEDDTERTKILAEKYLSKKFSNKEGDKK